MNIQHPLALAALSVAVIGSTSLSHAAPVSGQGTWETTLQGRDLDGNLSTFEAYYDTALNITWLADANYAMTTGADADGIMDWTTANSWAAGLNPYGSGITGWRLPTNTPLNGSTYNINFSNNGAADLGTATTTTDGTNGGWRDGAGIPVSEMGNMYYVTLGNLGHCIPNGSVSNTCDTQTGFGLSNTADFSNVQSDYWAGSELDSSFAWFFSPSNGQQIFGDKSGFLFAWAVHSGDVGAPTVPVPAAVWLFGSGLIGLLGMSRKRPALILLSFK
jgi:hypothetical protein